MVRALIYWQVLLAGEAAALAESKPPMTLPTSGQLDHFSAALSL